MAGRRVKGELSDQERSDIAELYADGILLREISEAYDVSLATVRAIGRRAGHPGRSRRSRSRQARIDAVLAGYAAGRPLPELAEEHGFAQNTISAIVAAETGGEALRQPPLTDAARRDLLAMRRRGLTVVEAAAEAGVSQRLVYKTWRGAPAS